MERTKENLLQYKELILEVANGKSDIYGYSNLELKILPETEAFMKEYMDLIAKNHRTDTYIAPYSEENKNFALSDLANPLWREFSKPRFLPRHFMALNCDMYLWDGQVAICTITDGEFIITRYHDPSLFNLNKMLIESLWNIALDPYNLIQEAKSQLTAAEKDAYISQNTKIDLTDGSPHDITPPWIHEIQMNVKQHLFHSVHPSHFIQSIGAYFTNMFHTKDYILAPTATIALVAMCDTVIEIAGDEIIILDPGFDIYSGIITAAGGNAVLSVRNDDFSINIDNIVEKITNRTKAIIICSPENPFGVMHSKEKFISLTQICKEHGLTLIIDYCFYLIKPYGKVPFLLNEIVDTKDLSYILLADTGKIIGLGGTKLGVAMPSASLLEKLHNHVMKYYFQLNQYDLFVIDTILRDKRFPKYLQDFNHIIRDNYTYIKDHLNPIISVVPMDGTSLCLLDISQLHQHDEDFVYNLKRKTGVILIPVSYFYKRSHNKKDVYVRVALARQKKDIMDAVEQINIFLETL